jgi:hypothetical protein
MKTVDKPRLALMFALALGQAAYGQVPASNDTSDPDGITGMGFNVYAAAPSGAFDTACGFLAAQFLESGNDNTACGYAAMIFYSTGNGNTAFGESALASDEGGVGGGSDNTAVGSNAMPFIANTFLNTATGANTLNASDYAGGSTGAYNAAFGEGALASNNSNGNAALGYLALTADTTGAANTAAGFDALQANLTGDGNTALGYAALFTNTTGSNNIAVGYLAGYNLTTGSNNIDIGNEGVAGDENTIRIGVAGAPPPETVIAGIYGNSSVSGLPVVIDSNGQLGTVSSSDRFKTDIAPMRSATANLQGLRPVTFRYKADPQGTLRYGLIAEEVAKVYPELVVRDREGRIDGVRYDALAPMLLNEIQLREARIDRLERQFALVRAALRERQSQDQLAAARR